MPAAVARRRLKRTGAVIIAAAEAKARHELEQASRTIQADAADSSRVSLAAAGITHARTGEPAALIASWAAMLSRLETAGGVALGSSLLALQNAQSAAQEHDEGEEGGSPRRIPGAAQSSWLRSLLAAITKNGLTGYTDTAGRSWHLGTYARAAVMAAAGSLHIGVQLGTYTAAGSDLVIVVGPSAGSCQMCAPWVGAVLSISGTASSGQVDGTVDDALGGGLGHPHCRHDLVPLNS